MVSIGGDTSQPGLAPGNVIDSPNAVDILDLQSNQEHTPNVTLLGNLIGLDASGEKAAGRGDNGVIVERSIVNVGDGTEGGTNVISGFKYGVSMGGGELDGNLIGTNLNGTSAVGNTVGVYRNSTITINNVISGNTIGVGDPDTLGPAILNYGNIVGLARNGLDALPNRIGVEASVVIAGAPDWGDEIWHCKSNPCNVISGNTVAGIESENLQDLDLDGTYVGTDITGTHAVPNGIGISVSGGTLGSPTLLEDVIATLKRYYYDEPFPPVTVQPQLEIGGASNAASGTCEYPCNIIAGNRGAGLRLNRYSIALRNPENLKSYISGTYFGVSAAGEALPNGGPDIAITGVKEANPLRIGGSAAEGNVLNGVGSPLISVTGSANKNKTAPVAIEANIFEVSGGAKPISLPRFAISSPRLFDIGQVGSNLEVRGQISARAFFGHDQTLELYGTPSCTGTLSPLARFTITNQSGNFDVSVPLSDVTTDKFVTALVTDGDGYTSVFSTLDPLPASAALGC
jgi:hypothetical protein